MSKIFIALTIVLLLVSNCEAAGYLKLIFADPGCVPSFTNKENALSLTFKDDRLSKLFLRYKVIEFKKEYPIADSFPDDMTPAVNLRLVYKVIIDTTAGDTYDDLKKKIDFIKSPLLKTTVREYPSFSLVAPNDYSYNYYGSAYGGFASPLNLVNAQGAWNVTTGLSCIKVGITDISFQQHNDFIKSDGTSKIVISTPSNPQHCINPVPAYAISAANCSYYNYAPWDCVHGVAVAGVVGEATNNGVGGASLGYNISVEFYNNDYNGIVNAIYDKCKVVNCSWGKLVSSTILTPSADVQDVLNLASLNNVTIVAAAGNGKASGSNATDYYYPASYDGVISVTTVGDENEVGDSRGANWKDCHREFLLQADPSWDTSMTYQHNSRVDICAPGYYMQTVGDNNIYTMSGGTSFSAPMVSAAAGLLYSINPFFTPAQIEGYLKTYAKNIYNVYDNSRWTGLLGAGRLDAAASLQAAASSAYTGPSYCSSCPTETTYLTNTNYGSPSGTFYNKNITAGSNNGGVVQTSASASTTFVATNSVVLKPGFRAAPTTSSVTFSASIQSCVNGSRTTSADPAPLFSKSSLQDNLNKLVIYPNPAKNSIQVSFGSGNTEKADISIFNSYGVQVKSVTAFTSAKQDGNRTTIIIKDLPNGLYFVSLTAGGRKSTGKFIKTDQ